MVITGSGGKRIEAATCCCGECTDLIFDNSSPGELLDDGGIFCEGALCDYGPWSAAVLRLGDASIGSYACTKQFCGLLPNRLYYVRIYGKLDDDVGNSKSTTLSLTIGTATLSLNQAAGPGPSGPCTPAYCQMAEGVVTTDEDGCVEGSGSAVNGEDTDMGENPIICEVHFLCEDPNA